jgi:hypothetical protein
MKLAIESAPRIQLPAWPRPTAAALYRVAGLLIAVGVPTLFWTFALALMTKVAGTTVGVPALAAFGLIVAACCLVCASLAMSNRG